MIKLLRFFSLCLGCTLTIAPSLLMLQFAYGVGDPPKDMTETLLYLAITLFGGLVLGAGLLLVGLPNLVVGAQNPKFRWLGGLLLFLSVIILIFIVGVSGTVTEKVSPFLVLLQCAVFGVFIWPARNFQKT